MFFGRSSSSLVWIGIVLAATPAAAQTRVACVGDSITEGYGLASPGVDAYPAQLQALLGSDYDVSNFGVSGTTATQNGDKPYWNQAAFTQSGEFAPAIVLLMLGTNDAKPTNWNETTFRSDYTELVGHYRGLDARVLVATPPQVFGAGAFDISPTTVNDTLVPIVRELALALDVPLVDVFEATREHAEWFTDNVHPTREGATVIAATFANAVRELDQPSTSPPQTDAGSGASTVPQTDATPTETNEPPSGAITTNETAPTDSSGGAIQTSTANSAPSSQSSSRSDSSSSASSTISTAGTTSPSSSPHTSSTASATITTVAQTSSSPPTTTPERQSSACSIATHAPAPRPVAPVWLGYAASLWLACAVRRGRQGRKMQL